MFIWFVRHKIMSVVIYLFDLHKTSNDLDCIRRSDANITYVPPPKLEVCEGNYNSADQHLPMGYERQLNYPKILDSYDENEESKLATKKTDSSPLFESTAPRRTIRKKHRSKCIK